MELNRFKQLLESELGNVKPLITENMKDFPVCVRYAGEIKGDYILVRKAHTDAHGEKLDYKWGKDGTLLYAVADDFHDKDMAGRILGTTYYYCKCVNKKCIPKIIKEPIYGMTHECTDKKPCK